MSAMSAAEYIKIRCKHMELMAQHKYGLRVKDNEVFSKLSTELGMAAVTVDMLEVKHTSPVTLSTQNHSGRASRGAAFILYNSARIDKLVRTYNENIASGHYPAPVDSSHIDWTLLKEEDEWQLMFNYVLEFPNVVRRSLGDVTRGSIAPHLVCTFLSGLVRCFSVYYRRVRILDYNRKHLMGTLLCRMKLLLAVQQVLHQSLALLNIQPVRNM